MEECMEDVKLGDAMNSHAFRGQSSLPFMTGSESVPDHQRTGNRWRVGTQITAAQVKAETVALSISGFAVSRTRRSSREDMTLDMTENSISTSGPAASVSSFSSGPTVTSSCRATTKVIYYQNRFIVVQLPPSAAANRHSFAFVTSGESENELTSHPVRNQQPAEMSGCCRPDRKSQLIGKIRDLLHDKDKKGKTKSECSSSEDGSRLKMALVKCLNMMFLSMGILLFVAVLGAIVFSSFAQSTEDSNDTMRHSTQPLEQDFLKSG